MKSDKRPHNKRHLSTSQEKLPLPMAVYEAPPNTQFLPESIPTWHLDHSSATLVQLTVMSNRQINTQKDTQTMEHG